MLHIKLIRNPQHLDARWIQTNRDAIIGIVARRCDIDHDKIAFIVEDLNPLSHNCLTWELIIEVPSDLAIDDKAKAVNDCIVADFCRDVKMPGVTGGIKVIFVQSYHTSMSSTVQELTEMLAGTTDA